MKRTPVLIAPPLLAALLAACGGTERPADDVNAVARTSQSAEATASWPVAPLLADDGSVMPSAPQAVPADPGAHTRAGRYASPAQAEQLEQALGPGALRVAVRGSGAEAVEEAAGVIHRQLAAKNLPASAPVLVEGTDLRTAAALVDRLAADSVANTWLVTP